MKTSKPKIKRKIMIPDFKRSKKIMEENKVENVIDIIKDMDTKDKLRLGICLTTSVGLIFYIIKLKCTRNLILC